MKVFRLAPAALAAGVLACAGSTATAPGSALSSAVRDRVAGSLVDLATAATDPHVARTLDFAASLVAGGSGATTVIVNGGTTALGATDAATPLAEGGAGASYAAMAFRIHSSVPNDTFTISAILLFRDTTDIIVSYGPGDEAGGAPGDQTGTLLWTPPTAYWNATAGPASMARTSTGATCPGVLLTAPERTVACRTATFAGAVQIGGAAADSAFPGNTATGTRTVSLGTHTFDGYDITVSASGK